MQLVRVSHAPLAVGLEPCELPSVEARSADMAGWPAVLTARGRFLSAVHGHA